MKNGSITLEYTTHCLSSGNRDDVSDRFQRDSDNHIVWNAAWWYSALSAAIPNSGTTGIKPGCLNFHAVVEAPTAVYRRKYGWDKYRSHEAIMSGTKVTFKFVAGDHVTETALKQIMDYLGSYVGLSPYGFNLGYGRFKVVSLDLK